MENILEGRKLEFVAPSGYKYTIREQNGADDDILSNPVDAATMRNLSAFIAAIVVNTDFTPNGKLTVDQAHNLPCLDRYCILFNSRIHSLGDEVEFEYDWGKDNGGVANYVQDVNEFLFDYSKVPSEEEMEEKPNAIPFYPNGKQFKDIKVELSSGKVVKFDLLTAEGEAYILNLAPNKRTKNQELVARNLCLEVNGNFEKVTSFHLFSVKDMMEIRKEVFAYDPVFNGVSEIVNPNDSTQTTLISVVAIKDFFYPGEI